MIRRQSVDPTFIGTVFALEEYVDIVGYVKNTSLATRG